MRVYFMFQSQSISCLKPKPREKRETRRSEQRRTQKNEEKGKHESKILEWCIEIYA
jgi:hypothetical protein